jgi:hypothetical protein
MSRYDASRVFRGKCAAAGLYAAAVISALAARSHFAHSLLLGNRSWSRQFRIHRRQLVRLNSHTQFMISRPTQPPPPRVQRSFFEHA